jgi:hypothetical protein
MRQISSVVEVPDVSVHAASDAVEWPEAPAAENTSKQEQV